MLRLRNNITVLGVVALLCSVAAGCATSGDVNQVYEETQAAREAAEEAKAAAAAALAAAEEARTAAAEADARSQRTEESINRMFQRSMYK